MLATDMHNWSVNAQRTQSPYKLFNGRVPVTKHVKPFGSPARIQLPHEKLKKLDERVRHEGIFVGYKQPSGLMQYLVLVRGKVYSSCNVTFLEACSPALQPRLLSVIMTPDLPTVHDGSHLSLSVLHEHDNIINTTHTNSASTITSQKQHIQTPRA